jgi:hypothetical protein
MNAITHAKGKRMKRYKITDRIRSLFVVALLCPLWAHAAVWYVTPTGSNANTCTDKLTPCLTIQGVHDKAAFVSGDQIQLMEGTYNNSSATQITLTKVTEIYGGYNSSFTSRKKDPSKTILTATGNTPVRLFNVQTGKGAYTIFDGVQISGLVSTAASSGTITTAGVGAWIKLNNVKVSNNSATTGGGLYAAIAGDKVIITNSTFSGNTAKTSVGGGIRLGAGTRLIMSNSIIDNNQTIDVSQHGGGMYIAGGSVAELVATTIYGNTAVGNAGAVFITGAGSSFSCTHCTIVKNTSGVAAAKNIQAATSAAVYFKNSVLINEAGAGVAGTNLHISGGATFADGGYNAWGINNLSGFSAATPAPTTNGNRINTEATVADLYESNIALNGGTVKSLKLTPNSSLIDAIPNDVPASSTGTSPSTPFTSIAQAHSAMKAYEHYKAGYYFFNLSGQAFKTYVDKSGYVLVASGNGTAATSLEQTANLTVQSDAILAPAAFAQMSTIDEIRISSPISKLGDFDMVTKNATNITRLKGYLPLHNNWDLFATANYNPSPWYGTHDDRMNGASGSDLGWYGVSLLSHNIIGHNGDGTDFHWQMERAGGPYVTVVWSTPSPRDLINLWVRSSKASCGGVVSTDQRGLYLPDYANPNDTAQYGDIRDCDIGAFEWNNGYRLDCYSEDGQRPENSISGASATVCVNDFNSLTPKALVDNFGSVQWPSLLLLAIFSLFRSRKIFV